MHEDLDDKVPERISKARAAALAGVGRPVLDKWIAEGVLAVHGDYAQIDRKELEQRIGREIGFREWGLATARMAREALDRAEAAE